MDWRAKGLSTPATPTFLSGLYLTVEILVGSIDGYIGPLCGSYGRPMISSKESNYRGLFLGS